MTGGVVQGAYSQYLDFLGDQFFSTPVFLVIVGKVDYIGCPRKCPLVIREPNNNIYDPIVQMDIFSRTPGIIRWGISALLSSATLL